MGSSNLQMRRNPDGQDFDRDLRETYNGVENIEAFVYAGKVKILPGDVDEVTVETSRSIRSCILRSIRMETV